MKNIRLLVGDAQMLNRLGLVTILNGQSDMTVVAEASEARLVLELCAEVQPDVALLDLRLSGWEGLETIKLLGAMLKPISVIALAATVQEEEVFRVYEAGARGYFPTFMGQDALLEAIHTVHRGENWIPPVAVECLFGWIASGGLSSCERDILQLLPQWANGHEISKGLLHSKEAMRRRRQRLLGEFEKGFPASREIELYEMLRHADCASACLNIPGSQ